MAESPQDPQEFIVSRSVILSEAKDLYHKQKSAKAKTFFFTVAASTIAAIVYGLIHDQITIRICPEYFTVWHPHVVDSQNITLVALVWGVIATWWMGIFLGILLGACAVACKRPVASHHQILRCIVNVMIASAIGAIVLGLLAWQLRITVPPYIMKEQITDMPIDVQQRFAIDLFIHNGSYNVAPFAAIIFGVLMIGKRGRPSAAVP